MEEIKRELYPLLMTIGIALGGIIIGRIIYFIGEKYLKKIFEKTETSLDDKILRIVSRFINPLFFFAALDFAFYFIEQNKIGMVPNIFVKINEIMIIIIVSIMTDKILNAIFEELPEMEANKKEEKRRNIAMAVPILKNFGIIVIFIISISMIIIKMGYSPVSILTGMGIAGVAVSFAAQNTIANFLSGIFILFDGPFTIGDRIKMGEVMGEVVEIGIRNTRIQTADNNIITVPNSNITSKEVTNYCKPSNEEKVFYTINTSYGSDVEKTKTILDDVIKKIRGIILEKNIEVYLVKLNNYSLDFQAIFWIADYKEKFRIVDEINRNVIEKFKRAGIEIPFPTYDINTKNR